ncbi:HlyD family secretion protein [Caenispirillum bisanense]|uniref:Multidrug resistance efflux pump n=1 Tax=Caenispirillum bisanense TaxID=414052 RepID=A0A286GTX0_9PROT|nr:HlyD family efflux transporter periplasmic adaptor subunit [Caenispirillum bisanense]SOD98539.1 Multidrug resistance efflux pump [Caenispirillum bisanense]
MRIVKLVVAGSIVVLGSFVIIGEQLSGASTDAVINARLTTVTAPVAGQLTLADRPLGALVRRGEQLGSIQDPLVDTIRLDDLSLERSLAQSERTRLSEQISAINQSVDGLTKRSDRYRNERIRQLEAEVAAAGARAEAAKARLEEARGTLRRAEDLSGRGYQTAAALESARADARVAERTLEQAQNELSVSNIQLEAARNGTFLGDSYNDAPYSEQRVEELFLRRQELEAQLAEVTERIAALTDRIAAEQRRVARFSGSEIAANVNGRLWQIPAGDGERVQRGEPVMRLVNCESVIVTLSVTESVYNDLRIGDPATFRLRGSDVAFEGTISRLAGSGAATIYENLAVKPGQKQLERYDVTLLLPALRDDQELGCAIGRTGRAFFTARPLDRLRAWIGGDGA